MLEVANLEVVYNDVIAVLRGLSLTVPDEQVDQAIERLKKFKEQEMTATVAAK